METMSTEGAGSSSNLWGERPKLFSSENTLCCTMLHTASLQTCYEQSSAKSLIRSSWIWAHWNKIWPENGHSIYSLLLVVAVLAFLEWQQEIHYLQRRVH